MSFRDTHYNQYNSLLPWYHWTQSLERAMEAADLLSSKKRLNNLLHRDDIKIFAENIKEVESLIQSVRNFSRDIGIEYAIEKLLITNIGK